jgi:hypothetical protein
MWGGKNGQRRRAKQILPRVAHNVNGAEAKACRQDDKPFHPFHTFRSCAFLRSRFRIRTVRKLAAGTANLTLLGFHFDL